MNNLFKPSLYTFGCMSLGTDADRIDEHVALARHAMSAGVWFHASPTYNRGFCFMVLRLAFDESPAEIPPLILKVRDPDPRWMRFEVEDSCRRLGIDAIDVAQLVSMTPDLVEQLNRNDGPMVEELASLRQRGLVKRTAIFTKSPAAADTVSHDLVDGLICYWNAFQRSCGDDTWARVQRDGTPLLALRTLAGGPEDIRTADRRTSLSKIVADAGCKSDTEFNIRLAASYDCVKTTIGGTGRLTHLQQFLDAAQDARPLSSDVLEKVDKLF